MLIRFFIYLFIPILIMGACSGERQKAYNYFYALCTIRQSAIDNTKTYLHLKKSIFNEEGKDSLKNNFLKQLKDAEKKIRDLQFLGDDFGLKEALLKDISGTRELLVSEFHRTQLKKNSTFYIEESIRHLDSLDRIAKKSELLNKTIIAKQLKFAKRYHIRVIQPNDNQ